MQRLVCGRWSILTALTELLEDRAEPGLGLGNRNSGFEDVLFVGFVRIHGSVTPKGVVFPGKIAV